jgi:hypothetical protein
VSAAHDKLWHMLPNSFGVQSVIMVFIIDNKYITDVAKVYYYFVFWVSHIYHHALYIVYMSLLVVQKMGHL